MQFTTFSIFQFFTFATLQLQKFEDLKVLLFSIFTFICGVTYLILKLIFWNYFEFGMAPLIILISFGLSIIIFFLGIIGEYIGAIHSEVIKRPRVLEKQRKNYPVKNLLNRNQ